MQDVDEATTPNQEVLIIIRLSRKLVIDLDSSFTVVISDYGDMHGGSLVSATQ
jgi:hypothetical protein